MARTLNKTVTLHLNSAKTHSVRYDAKDEEAKQVASALYVGKESFEGSGAYPETITVTVSAG